MKTPVKRPRWIIIFALSLAMGLLTGAIWMLILGHSIGAVMGAMAPGKSFWPLFAAHTAPLLLLSLSACFSYKAGLYNLGAGGQFMLGALIMRYGGSALGQSAAVCIACAGLGGALLGFACGVFRVKLFVHECVPGMMLTGIVYYCGRLMAADAVAPSFAMRPWTGLITGALAVLLMVFVLYHTVLGYELRACGSDRAAAHDAGVPTGRRMILALTVSGALAGLGGACCQETAGDFLRYLTHDGIPAAVLGAAHPWAAAAESLVLAWTRAAAEAAADGVMKKLQFLPAIMAYVSAFCWLIRIGVFNRRNGWHRTDTPTLM